MLGNLHNFLINLGTYRHGARRGSAHGMKDADGTSVGEGKPSRRGGPSGYGSRGHEVSLLSLRIMVSKL